MDKRSQKTKEAIFRAFSELSAKAAISVRDLSVMDIAKQAGISRSTFYAHYNDMNDLINDIAGQTAQDIRTILLTELKKYSVQGNSCIRQAIFLILCYFQGKGPCSQYIFLSCSPDRMIHPVLDTVQNFLFDASFGQPRSADSNAAHSDAVLQAYGIYGLMREWMMEGCQTEVGTMTDRIFRAIQSAEDIPA